jgi:hypothetical protein
MQLQTKKIIAREFLLLMLAIIIAVIGFFCTYPYNNYRQKQVDAIHDTIATKQIIAADLTKSYNEKVIKQSHFNDDFRSHFNDYETNMDTIWNTLYFIAKSNSMTDRWNNKWDGKLKGFFIQEGFTKASVLKDFILTNILYKKDLDNKAKSDVLFIEISNLENKATDISRRRMSFENQLRTAGLVFLIAITILFALRYLFYAIKWSIKIVRQ